jgi:hypothetical protein
MKKIGVELGTSSQGYFEGVGVTAVSFPMYKDEIFFLYPTYYSSWHYKMTLNDRKNPGVKLGTPTFMLFPFW